MVVKKMKEKCKDAARMRREKERIEFLELSKLLPLPSSTTSQLDKASIIRLTSSYLRMRSAFPWGLGDNWGTRERRSCHIGPQNFTAVQQEITGLDESQQIQNVANVCKSSGMMQNPPETMPSCQSNKCQQSQSRMRELGSLILQTLDGFVFALHVEDGKIMYISETASVQLGLSQIDLTGSSIFEYVHPADHNDIYRLLSLSDTEKLKLEQETEAYCELSRSFCMRMKCILPKRNAGLVSNGYKVIHCNGYLKFKYQASAGHDSKSRPCLNYAQTPASTDNCNQRRSSNWEAYALVAIGHSLLPTATTEYKMTLNSFMFRADMDLKIYYIELQATSLLGFEQTDLIDQSLYQFVHINDVQSLERGHRLLLAKGQLVSKYIRLMKKDGGSVWVQTYANLRSVPKVPNIVGVCYVIGEDFQDESRLLCNEKQVKTTNHNYKETVQPIDTSTKPNLERKRKDRFTDTAQKKPQKKCKSSQYYEMPQDATVRDTDNTTSDIVTLVWNKEHGGIKGYDNYQDPDKVNQVRYMTIGSTRRASDDSSSIISSIASTSFSSTSPTIEKSRPPQQRISSNDCLYRSDPDSGTTSSEIDQSINCTESFQPVWTRPSYQSQVVEMPHATYESQYHLNSKIVEFHPNQQPPCNEFGQESYSTCAQYKSICVFDTAQVIDQKTQFVDMETHPLTSSNEWVLGSESHQTVHYDVMGCEAPPNMEHLSTSNYQSGKLDMDLRLDYNQDVSFSKQPLKNVASAP